MEAAALSIAESLGNTTSAYMSIHHRGKDCSKGFQDYILKEPLPGRYAPFTSWNFSNSIGKMSIPFCDMSGDFIKAICDQHVCPERKLYTWDEEVGKKLTPSLDSCSKLFTTFVVYTHICCVHTES